MGAIILFTIPENNYTKINLGVRFYTVGKANPAVPFDNKSMETCLSV